MIINKVSYGVRKNLGNFQHEELLVEIGNDPDAPASGDEMFSEAKALCMRHITQGAVPTISHNTTVNAAPVAPATQAYQPQQQANRGPARVYGPTPNRSGLPYQYKLPYEKVVSPQMAAIKAQMKASGGGFDSNSKLFASNVAIPGAEQWLVSAKIPATAPVQTGFETMSEGDSQLPWENTGA